LLVGNVVHRTLEEIVTGELRPQEGELDDAATRTPRAVSWPDPESLAEITRRKAREVLEEDGIGLEGLSTALAEVVAPYLEAAGGDWRHPGGTLEILGAEVRGRLPLPSQDGTGPRELLFTADRVDHDEAGRLRLTDYKTGRNPWDLKRPQSRHDKLRKSVARGEALQAVAYQRAGQALRSDAHGRYLFVSPQAQHRAYAVQPEDHDLHQAFDTALGSLLAAWEDGAFFPRLVDPRSEQEPPGCTYCPVAEACLRGDSGARRRLLALGNREEAPHTAGEAFLDLWNLRSDS
jgi:hypothetical protein